MKKHIRVVVLVVLLLACALYLLGSVLSMGFAFIALVVEGWGWLFFLGDRKSESDEDHVKNNKN